MELDFTEVFETWGKSFTAYEYVGGYHDYEQGGEWVEGEEVEYTLTGIITPLTNDDTRFEEGGTYTREDIKIHQQIVEGEKLMGTKKKNWKVLYKGDIYKVLDQKLYDEHTGFNEYYARRLEEGEE